MGPRGYDIHFLGGRAGNETFTCLIEKREQIKKKSFPFFSPWEESQMPDSEEQPPVREPVTLENFLFFL